MRLAMARVHADSREVAPCVHARARMLHPILPASLLHPSMQAGTFEERNMSAWTQKRAKELLAGAQLDSGQLAGAPSGASLQVDSVTSVSGDANVYHVRGKKR